VQADHLAKRHGEQAVGIAVAQVLLGGEGQAAHIVEAHEVVGVDAQFREAFAVVGDVAGHPCQGGLEPLQLQAAQVLAA
jgi:hypothetical protein